MRRLEKQSLTTFLVRKNSPCLQVSGQQSATATEDGLALFFDVHPKGQKPIPYVTTRKDRSSAWQKPERLLFQRLIPG